MDEQLLNLVFRMKRRMNLNAELVRLKHEFYQELWRDWLFSKILFTFFVLLKVNKLFQRKEGVCLAFLHDLSVIVTFLCFCVYL